MKRFLTRPAIGNRWGEGRVALTPRTIATILRLGRLDRDHSQRVVQKSHDLLGLGGSLDLSILKPLVDVLIPVLLAKNALAGL